LNGEYNGKKIITKYRDEILIKRAKILNKYAYETSQKGEMYYIYSKNSQNEDKYNLCICEEGKSHIVIEASKEELPSNIQIGSVLRKTGDLYILDEESTIEVKKEITNIIDELIKEQAEFLDSKRIEDHIYEMSENSGDRACLFDITSGENEEIEEIDFPMELLNDSKEGDLFIYKNGQYQKY